MLVLAGLNAWMFHGTIYKRVREWDTVAGRAARARVWRARLAVLWAGIIVVRPDDRLQLVRLRPPSVRLHRLGGGLHGRTAIAMCGRWIMLSIFSVVSKRRSLGTVDSRVDMGVRGDRIRAPARAGRDWRRGAPRRSAAARLRADAPAGHESARDALAAGSIGSLIVMLVDRHRAFFSEADQVLLQHAVLGEDVLAGAGDHLHLHGPASVCSQNDHVSPAAGMIVALRVADALVRRRRRRTVDWLLGIDGEFRNSRN